ncbi:MAG: hypothetical protein AB2693_22110 [Candidatus Thiodiazotropha sp.]
MNKEADIDAMGEKWKKSSKHMTSPSTDGLAIGNYPSLREQVEGSYTERKKKRITHFF